MENTATLSTRTLTGIRMMLPLTSEQEVALERLAHEEAVLVGLAGAINQSLVDNMDARRIHDTLEIARDVSQLRCAVFRTILVEEEQRKPRA